ncbi:MBL fold metallo-hydrolase [Rathayibacter soli]|uniref:MBL fold metallo-hydrolase n=1 Tax=Rathayibacter soli TaxID=3144168 RepID=UPI0027E44A72|nr:MBL fold metallo-hydrolase [Glaciibacter superstes]
MATEADGATVTIRYVGGPTAILTIGGVRFVTDPTFDPPADYPIGTRVLSKTAGPAFPAEQAGPVDVVLLSHDQHPDNLDVAGRSFLATVPLVLSTAAARGRLGSTVQVLPNWDHVQLPRPDGGHLTVTGVPAQHGPDGSLGAVGEVTGFVVSGDGVPTVYISGDNASLEIVRAVAKRFAPIDIVLLFAGAARTALMDGALLTMTSAQAAEAAQILDALHVVPLHFEGWAHFTEDADSLRVAFERAGLTDRLHLLTPGAQFTT